MTAPGARHLRTLGRYLGRHRREVLAAASCSAAVVALLALLPSWVSGLVREVLPRHDGAALVAALGRGMAIIAVLAVVIFGRDVVLMRLSARFAAETRERMFAAVLRRPFTVSRDPLSAELLSRLTSDITLLHRSLIDGLAVFAPQLVTVGALLVVMLAASWQLSLGAVVLVLPLLRVIDRFGRRLHVAVGVSQSRLAEMTAFAADCTEAERETKTFAREPFLLARFHALSARALASQLREERLASMHPSAVMLVGVAGLFGLGLLGAWLLGRGSVDTDHVLRFGVGLGLLVGPLQETTRSANAVTRLFAVLDRCQQVIDAPAEQDARGAAVLGTVRGGLTFDGVVVAYAQTGFRLGPIALEIAPGETIAVVGPSGAGKSTLLDLVPRLLEPTAGVVRLDGQPIAAYRRESVRAQIGVVSQQPFLFPGTLLENIRFGRLEATVAEVHAAARAAHVEEFVARLPRGYDTVLERRGANLSVGQRQRIALARAILKAPPILLLDEPTSALDVESEQLLQDSLRRVCAGRTTVIVTHRPSLVRDATRVVVLAQGRVVDVGAPAALVERGVLDPAFAHPRAGGVRAVSGVGAAGS